MESKFRLNLYNSHEPLNIVEVGGDFFMGNNSKNRKERYFNPSFYLIYLFLFIIVIIIFFGYIKIGNIQPSNEEFENGVEKSLLEINRKLIVQNEQIDSVENEIKNINSNIEELDFKVEKLDPNRFSEMSKAMEKSVVLILTQPVKGENEESVGAVYVDNSGQKWNKGTGFFVREDGAIATAHHVVEDFLKDGGKIRIFFYASNNFAFIEGTQMNNAISESQDLALLYPNITGVKIHPVKLVDSDSVAVGSNIGFLGFPLNIEHPILHDGIISSVTINGTKPNGRYQYLYTLNSFVNHGNSGGPVFLKETGEVIGVINSRIEEEGFGQVGIGYSSAMASDIFELAEVYGIPD